MPSAASRSGPRSTCSVPDCSASDRTPEVDPPEHLHPGKVERLEVLHDEAAGPHGGIDRPVEMAAGREPALDRREPVLPADDSGIGCEPVLEEVEDPAGLEHPG